MLLRDIKGIGIVYEKQLNEAGIVTLDDIVLTDVRDIAQKTGITTARLKDWKKEAKRKVRYKHAEIAEDMKAIAHIEITDDTAQVTIKDVTHENVAVHRGMFEDLKQTITKEKIAVFFQDPPRLWFNGLWYDDIPVKVRTKPVKKTEKKTSLYKKMQEWWKK
jgi:hypothetical protein